MKKEYNYNSIQLFRTSNDGILSTISKRHQDYPFGSFITYVTGRDRSIYFYLSDIAEHTKNLKNNNKACLTISKKIKLGDKQNSQRLTIIGNLSELDKEEFESCENRYYSFFLESKEYSKFHSFNFYKLEPISARWIGGFGKICWLEIDEWIKNENHIEWKKNEDKIIQHMNTDHHNTIVSSLVSQNQIIDHAAKTIFLTKDGYYAKTNKGIFFVQFDNCTKTEQDYRKELVILAKRYRDKEIKI